MGLAKLTAALRLPSQLLEQAYVARARSRTKAAPPPLFILGHWRSGTTHLYNILAKSDHFAFVSPFATALPWDFLGIGRAMEPLLSRALPEHRYIDKISVGPESPQEDEIALANMTPLSFYHALYFPKAFDHFFQRGVFFDGVSKDEIRAWQDLLRTFYAKLMLRQPGRRLVIKNPVYTARATMLNAMWPDALFIHIHRDPAKVFVSMRNFYYRLFEQFALQRWDHVDVDEVVFATYERMMDQLIEQTARLPAERFIEIRYDRLQGDEIACLRQIYEQLGLSHFEQDRPAFQGYLDSIRGYQKNKFELPTDLRRRIESRWARFYDHWDYPREAG